MKATFDEIIDVSKIGTTEAGLNQSEVTILASKEEKNPAKLDKKRVEMFLIDEQNDFISPVGSLPVPGAIEDTERLCRFIYKFMEQIYRIHYTLDWHSQNHIFFESAWVYGKDYKDEFGDHKEGDHVVPGTVISYKKIKNGIFKTTLPNKKRVQDYVMRVDRSKLNRGKNTSDELRLWPYHCRVNSWGAALEGELNKMIMYHSTVREISPMFYYKGQDQYSEQYGALQKEYSARNEVRKDILQILKNTRVARVYFAGQAESHCVLRTVWQFVKQFENSPEILGKIWVLEDCMSNIPGFEEATAEKFAEMQRMGIHLVKSTDITDLLM